MPLFLLSFAIAVAFLPGALDPITVPRWAVMAIGVPALLLISREPTGGLRGMGLLALAAMGFGLAWAPDLLNGIYDFAHLVILAGVFCLGASTPNLRPAWAGLIAGVAVSALIGLAQLAGWAGVAQAVIPGGLFMNKNLLAEAGMVALVAALAHGWYLAAIPPAGVVLMGQSRGVMMALGATAVIALWHRQRQAALTVAALLVLLVAWAFTAAGVSTGLRLDAWRAAITGSTFLGHGLGSFAATFPYMEFAHSEPLQAVYELGVIALLPAAILAHVWMERTHEPEHLVLAAVLLVGLVSFPLHMPVTGFAAALAAGRLAGARDRVRRSNDELGAEGGSAFEWGADRPGGVSFPAGRGHSVLPAGQTAATSALGGASPDCAASIGERVHPTCFLTRGATP